MIEFLVHLVVVLIVLGLLYWVLTMIPLPEPLRQIATVVIVVIFALWLVSVLLGWVPPGPLFKR